MKFSKYLALSLFLFINSCDNGADKDTTAPKALELNSTKIKKQVILAWGIPEDKDVKSFIIEHSNNNLDFVEGMVLENGVYHTTIDIPINIENYWRLRVVDKAGNKGEPSNTIYMMVVEPEFFEIKAWDMISEEKLDSAKLMFDKILDNEYLEESEKLNAYSGKGWALLKQVDGDPSEPLLETTIELFEKSSKDDAIAGRVIAYFLNGNYKDAALNADKFDEITTYKHKFLDINQRYLLIYAAYAHFYLGNMEKVRYYLDKLVPENAPHSVDVIGSSKVLQDLIEYLEPPKAHKFSEF